MSSRFVIYLSTIIVFFQFDSVNAQSIEEELKECSEIEVSLIRLQCYDRITASPDVKNAKPVEKEGIYFLDLPIEMRLLMR